MLFRSQYKVDTGLMTRTQAIEELYQMRKKSYETKIQQAVGYDTDLTESSVEWLHFAPTEIKELQSVRM